MINPQTLGQIVCLTREGVNRAFYNAKLQKIPRGYGEAHSLPYSSSVADPSHSPIERGQRHGVRERVCKRLGGGVSSGCSGGRYRIGELGVINNLGKDFDLWIAFLRGPRVLTQRINLSQRSLDG